MAVKITSSVLDQAIALKDAGDIAGAWNVLASADDLYAASARDIIEQIDSPTSVFAKIVQVHWDRVAPGARQTVFMDVGLQHLIQYLDLIQQDPSGTTPSGEQQYLLPNTEEIENSYRRAVLDHQLPALTAVDSMFSVLDYNIEKDSDWIYALARTGNTQDISWGRMLDPELEAGRTVYDSKVFLNDGIEPIKEILATAAMVRVKYGSFAADQMLQMMWDAIGDIAPQVFGLESPQAISMSASLLLRIDESMTESKMLRLLDAVTLGDNAESQRRDLTWLTRNLSQALYGIDPGLFATEEALFNAA